ncbi:hypothetical protein MPH_13807 [Macrophomina phaseolina MS6]|uniref:Rhodopsin domain-containing protein n=1 Tax=Macrophomina phaseolina (strain MS6) TaxID=1126212 RepID=K2R8H2_MACPH|nr:hypothetical protein MPH_13807 [Macrophomina phaseolina MS6]
MAVEIAGGGGDSVFAICAIGLALVWSSLALRIYVRAYVIRYWGWDDSMMIAAAICSVIMTGSILSLGKNNFAKPAAFLSVDALVNLYKACLVAELGYISTALFFRLCVGFFYLRLTPVLWHIWTIRVIMVVTSLYSTAYFLLVLNQCTPVSFFWTHFVRDTNGNCIPMSVAIGATYAHNSLMVLTDWIFNSLPLFLIIPSAMDRRTKIIALLLLGLGAVASVGIIIRFIAITKIPFSHSAVPLTPPIAFWSALETCAGMLAANIATYRPLIRSIAKSVKSAINSEERNSRTHNGGRTTINLTHIHLPGSRSRPQRSGRHPRTGYILSEDIDGQELSAWDREQSPGPPRTGESDADSNMNTHERSVCTLGSDEEVRLNPVVLNA